MVLMIIFGSKREVLTASVVFRELHHYSLLLLLLSISQIDLGLSALLCLLYPDDSTGCVTAVVCVSYQKIAALYGMICHDLLDALTTYMLF
jgi:hypothetical protein